MDTAASFNGALTPAAITSHLQQNRQRLGYKATNIARAIDNGPFVHGLRRWVVPSVLGSSLLWMGTAALNAPPEERGKKLIQYGLSVAGTVGAALYGFKVIMKPDVHTAGTVGKLALEHLGELLPKSQLAQLPHEAGELLGKAAKELGLGHLPGALKKKGKALPLEDVLGELDSADDVLNVLGHLNLPVGDFGERIAHWAKAAESAGSKGLSAKDLQAFRIEMLEHILKSHGQPLPADLAARVAKLTGTGFNPGIIGKLRHHLEGMVHTVADWQDDIAEAASTKLKKGWEEAKALAHGRQKQATRLLNVVVDGPGGISSKDMYEEIWELSLMGLLPVLGGIVGGTLGDMASGEDWKQRLNPKLKEGTFQYLANIMLCNVGAMAFIGGTELLAKSPVKAISQWASKVNTRIGAMTAGILSVGVLGGSAIANFFGENFLNPLFDKGWSGMREHLSNRMKQEGVKGLFNDLYANRVPEPLDVILHIDDFATGAAISGLSFVEPFLALFYTLSGIRAGIGYRNRHHEAADKKSVQDKQDKQPASAAKASHRKTDGPSAAVQPLSPRLEAPLMYQVGAPQLSAASVQPAAAPAPLMPTTMPAFNNVTYVPTPVRPANLTTAAPA